MPTLTFDVQNQVIRRTDNFKVIAGSQNYLYAHFTFTSDWGDGTKTAQFYAECSDDPPYDVILDQNNTCLIPWEVLQYGDTRVRVDVFAGTRITTNYAVFRVHEDGYMDGGSSSQPPTPDVYAQIIDRMDDVEAIVEQAADRAEAAAEAAASSRDAAAQSAGSAGSSASAASSSANAASASALSASQSASAANSAKADAIAAKNDAVSAKNDAVSAKNDAVSARNDAVSAQEAAERAQAAAEDALEQMRTLIAGLTDIQIAMEDAAGRVVDVTVLGRIEG